MLDEVISTKEGRTFIFNRDEVFCFDTGIVLDGKEVAKELNYSTQNVSIILKSAIAKVYKKLKIDNKLLTPLDLVCIMLRMFNLVCEEDIKSFWRIIPSFIQKEIYEDALIRSGRN
jgi:hypothetical protein